MAELTKHQLKLIKQWTGGDVLVLTRAKGDEIIAAMDAPLDFIWDCHFKIFEMMAKAPFVQASAEMQKGLAQAQAQAKAAADETKH